MSNIFDDIAIIGTIDPKLGVSFEQADALDSLAQLKAAYESLAPDWTQAPEWARWYTIDASGKAYWFKFEPHLFGEIWFVGHDRYRKTGDIVLISLGIDWRLCKWQRPQVTA